MHICQMQQHMLKLMYHIWPKKHTCQSEDPTAKTHTLRTSLSLETQCLGHCMNLILGKVEQS